MILLRDCINGIEISTPYKNLEPYTNKNVRNRASVGEKIEQKCDVGCVDIPNFYSNLFCCNMFTQFGGNSSDVYVSACSQKPHRFSIKVKSEDFTGQEVCEKSSPDSAKALESNGRIQICLSMRWCGFCGKVPVYQEAKCTVVLQVYNDFQQRAYFGVGETSPEHHTPIPSLNYTLYTVFVEGFMLLSVHVQNQYSQVRNDLFLVVYYTLLTEFRQLQSCFYAVRVLTLTSSQVLYVKCLCYGVSIQDTF